MKVACVAVFVLSVLVLCDMAFSAPNCGSNGVQDQYASSFCSCYSGWAPSDRTQADCNTFAECPPHEPVDTRTKIGGFPPALYNASFFRDRYNVVIRQPLVLGRRNSTVRIQGGSNTCGYPGSLWYKKSNGLDCVDELYGSIPWTSHEMCGFKKTVKATRTTYTASIVVTYDDYIKDELGAFIRTVGVSLNVNVTFVTQTSVIYNLINLSPGITAVTVSVVGSVIFDQNTGYASVTLRTSAIWPYKVDTIKISSTPLPNTAEILTDVLFDVVAGCSDTTQSGCQQQYIMRINPNTGCNLGGNYLFNITVACRAGTCATPTNAGTYSVLIYNTDVCGVGGIDVGLSAGSLIPFSDAAGTTPASSFVPNQMVYFSFTLNSEAVTIDSMIIEKITAAATSTSDVLYDLHPATTTPGPSVAGQAAGLTITPAVTPAPPGVDCTLWFAVRLVDAIPSFRVLPSAAATVTMSLIVDITYHGNQKRTVELRGTLANGKASSSSQGLADIYISTNDGNVPDEMLDASTGSLLQPISPILLVITFMFLFMFRQH